MLRIGETFALVIACVVVVYIVVNWRRVWRHERLRPFLVPLAFMLCAWTATVVEGFLLEGTNLPLIVSAQQMAQLGHQTPMSRLLHAVEIAFYLAAAISLFVLILSHSTRAPETPE